MEDVKYLPVRSCGQVIRGAIIVLALCAAGFTAIWWLRGQLGLSRTTGAFLFFGLALLVIVPWEWWTVARHRYRKGAVLHQFTRAKLRPRALLWPALIAFQLVITYLQPASQVPWPVAVAVLVLLLAWIPVSAFQPTQLCAHGLLLESTFIPWEEGRAYRVEGKLFSVELRDGGTLPFSVPREKRAAVEAVLQAHGVPATRDPFTAV